MTDTYDQDAAVPNEIADNATLAGPKGIALVKAWPSGVTDPGWGLNPPPGSSEGFMPRYMRNEFGPRRVIHGFNRGLWVFAYIMRSLRLVCVDIDGKNGGLEHAKRLGMLPPTLAETSKSGDGFHLFYLTDDEWDPVKGFGRLGDRIGIEQGVDIRWTGCVYHYPQQRWNRRGIADLPAHMYELLQHREQKVAASAQRITSILEGDDELEILMLQAELEAELKKDIPEGKRNNTLYAIGSQLAQAGVPGWQEKVEARAAELDLDDAEITKLISNITRYSGA